MTDVEDLRNAKRELLKCGWVQGQPEAPDGSLCVMGALAKAQGSDFCAITQRRLHGILMNYLPYGCCEVAQFNDRLDTTFLDVLNLFDKALADLGGLG